MTDKVILREISKEQHNSAYTWLNIDHEGERIGKIRSSINGKMITIYSINIYSEFKGKGYARKIIETFQEEYDTIMADRVRPTAVGFWTKMGFKDDLCGNYVWTYIKPNKAIDGRYKSTYDDNVIVSNRIENRC